MAYDDEGDPGIVKRRVGSTLAMPSPCVLLVRLCGRVVPLGHLRAVWPEGRALALDSGPLAAVW